MAFKYAIALTGSIATGKSTVAKWFFDSGFSVIDADKITHQILDEQAEAILVMFGDTVVKKGKVDRKALGNIVFKNAAQRDKLEELLHPLIRKEIETLSKKEDTFKKPYIVDIPLFFEGKNYPIERSIVVYAPKVLQLERLMQRDGYDKATALQRIETQADIEKKKKEATYVIDNSANRQHLKDEYVRVKEAILGDFE
jgi:dephospho-CoA kinase